MARSIALLSCALVGLVAAQKPGLTPEVHPKLTTYRCTTSGGCKPATNYIVLDSLAHPVHQANNTYNCGDWGNPPNATACPTVEACRDNCIQEGISDYSTVGVTTRGSSLKLEMIVKNVTVSPRVYLLDDTQKKYEMVKFVGGEFAFDVDATRLPCGMNSALYLSEMEDDGGKSKLNPGGAYYGTGYCDAQCFVTPFINGVVSFYSPPNNLFPSRSLTVLLQGNLAGAGACCNEMDIWEANSRATHIAPHTCSKPGVYLCQGDECGDDGVCDKNGCAWNPYRLDQPTYYGRGGTFKVDTTKPFTVVTQFPKGADGKLAEIRRLYVQNGVVIRSETVAKAGLPAVDALNDELCAAEGADKYLELGGTAGMGDAITRGMVIAVSLWWDVGGGMEWLDGAASGAGPCNATEGFPPEVVKVEPFPEVTFSNLKWGELNSTFVSRHWKRSPQPLRLPQYQ